MGGHKKVTIREVAALAGVSISSVSRYLTDPKSIQPLAAYNIKNAIAELKYAPNPFAQSLKRGASKIIGIVVPHVECFFGKVCAAVSDYFFERGYVTFICESDNNGDKERFFVQEMIKLRVSGLIVVPSGLNTVFLEGVAQKQKNMVILGRYEDIGCDVISVDHEMIAFRLASFMLENNPCDELLLLLGPEAASSSRLALQGVSRALVETERPDVPMKSVYNCRNVENVASAIHELHDRIRPDYRPAVLAFGEDFLESAVMVLHQYGRDTLAKIDLGGLAMADAPDKLGLELPCAIKDPAYAGIMTAETLYKKITESHSGKAPVAPRTSDLKITYIFPPTRKAEPSLNSVDTEEINVQ